MTDDLDLVQMYYLDEEAIRVYQNLVQSIADKLREQYVLPFCRKHQLRFELYVNDNNQEDFRFIDHRTSLVMPGQRLYTLDGGPQMFELLEWEPSLWEDEMVGACVKPVTGQDLG